MSLLGRSGHDARTQAREELCSELSGLATTLPLPTHMCQVSISPRKPELSGCSLHLEIQQKRLSCSLRGSPTTLLPELKRLIEMERLLTPPRAQGSSQLGFEA